MKKIPTSAAGATGPTAASTQPRTAARVTSLGLDDDGIIPCEDGLIKGYSSDEDGDNSDISDFIDDGWDDPEDDSDFNPLDEEDEFCKHQSTQTCAKLAKKRKVQFVRQIVVYSICLIIMYEIIKWFIFYFLFPAESYRLYR